MRQIRQTGQKMGAIMNRKSLILLVVALVCLQTAAQDNDYGIWYEAGAGYKLHKRLTAEMTGSLRTDENGSNVQSFWIETGMKYKFNKHITAGLYYRLIEKREDDDLFYFRHRVFGEIKGSIPINRFELSARYRFQRQVKTYIENAEDETPQYYNRLKLNLSYNIRGLPLEPYISGELFSQTFASNDILIEKERYAAGLNWKINKRNTVGIEYMYQERKVIKPHYFNIIALNYSLLVK